MGTSASPPPHHLPQQERKAWLSLFYQGCTPLRPNFRGHACFSSCEGSSYPEARAPWAPSLHFLALALGEGEVEIFERGLFRAE